MKLNGRQWNLDAQIRANLSHIPRSSFLTLVLFFDDNATTHKLIILSWVEENQDDLQSIFGPVQLIISLTHHRKTNNFKQSEKCSPLMSLKHWQVLFNDTFVLETIRKLNVWIYSKNNYWRLKTVKLNNIYIHNMQVLTTAFPFTNIHANISLWKPKN